MRTIYRHDCPPTWQASGQPSGQGFGQPPANSTNLQTQPLAHCIEPQYDYQGELTSQAVLFNESLQAFAERANLLCQLHSAGKASTPEIYQQIQQLWREFDHNLNGLLAIELTESLN